MTTVSTRSLEPGLVWIVARQQVREARRDRWFVAYAVGFAALAALLANLALPGGVVAGYGATTRSAISLVALVQLVVPLIGLTMGAQALAGPRERGALRFVLAHPVSRTEVFIGTMIGLGSAVVAAVFAGFGAAGLVTALSGGTTDAGALLRMAGLASVLAIAMVGCGLVISAFARTTAGALGAAIMCWILLVFAADLGLMGAIVSGTLPLPVILGMTIANPVESFRLAALSGFDGTLDVLGPGGAYATERLGDALGPILVAVLIAWTLVSAFVAALVFHRRADA